MLADGNRFLPSSLPSFCAAVLLSDAPVLFQTTYVFIWPLLHSAQVCQMAKFQFSVWLNSPHYQPTGLIVANRSRQDRGIRLRPSIEPSLKRSSTKWEKLSARCCAKFSATIPWDKEFQCLMEHAANIAAGISVPPLPTESIIND